MKKKIYVFNNGGSFGLSSAQAIAEDGHCLAGHICSHVGFMAHDMGITSDWKHKYYNKHYGEGNWELIWVDNPQAHEGLQVAYKLNQKLGEIAKHKENQSKTEITMSNNIKNSN